MTTQTLHLAVVIYPATGEAPFLHGGKRPAKYKTASAAARKATELEELGDVEMTRVMTLDDAVRCFGTTPAARAKDLMHQGIDALLQHDWPNAHRLLTAAIASVQGSANGDAIRNIATAALKEIPTDVPA